MKDKLTNQRIVIKQPGGIDRLELQEEALPVPRPHEVRVRVLACGVAFGDVMLREGVTPGAKYPATPGYDLVGEVEAVGGAATRFQCGDRVAALPGLGGYSTYVCLPEAALVPVPAHLKPSEVVSVILNYTTAYQMLTKAAPLKAGDRVLMHGAAGGLGTAVLQLAKMLGITVYGTASTAKQSFIVQEGGIPIDYTRTDFVAEVRRLTGAGVDAVFDPIGGPHLLRSYAALNGKGTLVVCGASSMVQGTGSPKMKLLGTVLTLVRLKLRFDGRKVVTYSITMQKDKPSADIAAMIQWLNDGKIQPIIAQVLPLSQAREAHRLLEQTKPVGKIILEPGAGGD